MIKNNLNEELNKNLHHFTALGLNLIVNKNTGAVYEVSDRVVDIFSGKYKDKSILNQLKALSSNKKSIDTYQKTAKKIEKEKSAPNSLCLIISGRCNLSCKYCYGDYGSKKDADMRKSTAFSAVDFLFSQDSSSVEFDLFGGEPLLNWDVCKKTIEYIEKKSKKTGKKAKITLTTNAYAFDRAKQRYLNKHNVNLVLSLDGGKLCHNKLRKSTSSKDTFDVVYKNIKNFIVSKKSNYYVRGTYTGKTLDFYKSFKFYIDNSIKKFSLEPVVRQNGILSITKKDLVKIDNEYQKCAQLLLKANRKMKSFHFYHFDMNIYKPPCIEKKIRACAAGVKYFAVDYNGDIYPCHQFVGMKEFKMGQIKARGLAQKLQVAETNCNFGACPLNDEAPKNMIFKKNHIFNKPECKNCWVRVYCSGGCAASSYFHNKSIFIPDDINCEIMKIRTKYALAYNIRVKGQGTNRTAYSVHRTS